jgi:ElaB/YqjD/DUF883 family membrane-anchored ribosome-binding protein
MARFGVDYKTSRFHNNEGFIMEVKHNGNAPGETVDHMAASVHGAVDTVADATNRAVDAIGEKGEQLHHLQEEWLQASRNYIRDHPVQAVGIAIVGGFMLSRLLKAI